MGLRDTVRTDTGPAQNRPDRSGTVRSQMALPAVMILTGIVSVQVGAGIAAKLFHEIPPAAVTGLRLWTSAVAMAFAVRPRVPPLVR